MFCVLSYCFCFLFFFQAEDGIRDGHVTGVQTCALPICFALNRLISFGMILILSFLLVSSLIAEAVLGIISNFFTGLIPLVEIDLYLIFTQFGTAAVAIFAFTLLFIILSDVHAL